MESTLQLMASGEITPMTCALWVIMAGIAGGLGGILGANLLGGKALGKELVLMMGAPMGALVAAPGVLLALILLKLI